MSADAFDARVEAAASPYRSSGRYAWHYARGKFRHDPVFRHVAEAPLPLGRGKILDLGCGQGLLFSWLAAAPGGSDRDRGELHGIELRSGRVDIARRALGGRARIDLCDIRHAQLPTASVIVIVDVLLYLSAADQHHVLANAAHALEPGGMLLLREADRAAGARFHFTQWGERLAGAHRGRLWQPLHYRSVEEWRAALERLGLLVDVQPMSRGTPFSNVLYTARKR